VGGAHLLGDVERLRLGELLAGLDLEARDRRLDSLPIDETSLL
jgi:hypothetical protein